MIHKHSITLRGHRTSFSLENPFMDELRMIADERDLALAALITEIDEVRDPTANLSSALRLYVLNWLKAKARQA
ncbi:aryl-sulfate sulfotransferase [Rhizobium daejeonense]|uniref:Aryl-sulfate sulfotransferase n=1 Tax=Rhizobium daejeonense TaxID=240521 RepID=A0A6M1RV92_9HYPH|nr:ribbon-helix-helix domain-containing protein [Rhizobium daejeonense]NGO62845.1 aryl-sulfate sulfotransferase [Rhizobium daejeonense]